MRSERLEMCRGNVGVQLFPFLPILPEKSDFAVLNLRVDFYRSVNLR